MRDISLSTPIGSATLFSRVFNVAIPFAFSFFSSILFSFVKFFCSIADSSFRLLTESVTPADPNAS